MTGWRRVLKDNAFLVASVALPLVVVLFFLVARTLPAILVAPPAHDVLFSVPDYTASDQRSLRMEVRVVDNRLQVRWTRLEEPSYQVAHRVYRFHSEAGTVEEVQLPEPADPETLEGTTNLIVEDLSAYSVDSGPTAPDGYEFKASGRGGSGLMNELFGSRRRGSRSVLSKNGRTIAIPTIDTIPYRDAQVRFLGWLIATESGP